MLYVGGVELATGQQELQDMLIWTYFYVNLKYFTVATGRIESGLASGPSRSEYLSNINWFFPWNEQGTLLRLLCCIVCLCLASKIFHGKPRKIIHPSFDTVTMDPSYCLLYKISQLTYSLNFLEEKTSDASQKMHHKHCVLLKINLKRPL